MREPFHRTREQVNAMTLLDLRVLASEKAPPEGPAEVVVRARSIEDFHRLKAERNRAVEAKRAADPWGVGEPIAAERTRITGRF